MTPREIIKRNLTFSDPARLGMTFGGEGWLNDMRGGGLAASRLWTQKRWVEGNVEYSDDEWGNVWRRIVGMSAGGEIHEPALKDWAMLADLRLPDYDADYRFEPAREAFAEESEHYR
ncbi:MAG: hypothetical protein HY318_08395, partial [Armatimonadetes bacterium]|nr:hypothetical protein [Armatimonadota bacterium]